MILKGFVVVLSAVDAQRLLKFYNRLSMRSTIANNIVQGSWDKMVTPTSELILQVKAPYLVDPIANAPDRDISDWISDVEGEVGGSRPKGYKGPSRGELLHAIVLAMEEGFRERCTEFLRKKRERAGGRGLEMIEESILYALEGRPLRRHSLIPKLPKN